MLRGDIVWSVRGNYVVYSARYVRVRIKNVYFNAQLYVIVSIGCALYSNFVMRTTFQYY